MRDDDAICEVTRVAAVVDEDGPRNHRRRRRVVASLNDRLDVVGRQDLERGALSRTRQRVCVFAHVERAVSAVGTPVVADGLSNRHDVRFGERAAERRAPVPAGPEADHLVDVVEIWLALEVLALQTRHIDQHLRWGLTAGQGRDARPYLSLYRTGHGFTSQISCAYSAIARSLENFPEAATFRMALRTQAFRSAYNSRSRWSASR